MNKDFELTNGVRIPSVGFGTWQTPDGAMAIEAVQCAIRTGYRHIDTAAVYGNEQSVGEGIARSGIAREEILSRARCGTRKEGTIPRCGHSTARWPTSVWTISTST